MTHYEDTADPHALYQKCTANFTHRNVFKDERGVFSAKLSTVPGLKENTLETYWPTLQPLLFDPSSIKSSLSLETSSLAGILPSSTSIMDMLRESDERRAETWRQLQQSFEVRLPSFETPSFQPPQSIIDSFSALSMPPIYIPSPESRLADALNALVDRLNK